MAPLCQKEYLRRPVISLDYINKSEKGEQYLLPVTDGD
jgi:hypothetical protein